MRAHAGVIALILVAAAFYVPFTWSDELGSLGGDAAVYVLSAQHYAPYLAPDPVVEAVARETIYPPLYPLLLVASGGAADLHLAHAATTLCLVLAVAFLYFWLLQQGLSKALAVAGGALFLVMPGSPLHSLFLHSEALYLLLTLAFLVAAGRAERLRSARQFWLVAGVLAAALLSRTAALSLLPAFALLLLRQRPRHWYLQAAAAMAPAVLWAILHRPEQDYRESLLEHYGGLSFTDILWRLQYQADAMVWGFIGNVTQSLALQMPALVVAGLAFAVAVFRFFRGHLDAWYVGAYLAMVILWPYPAEAVRFAWVLTPFLIAYPIMFGAWLAQKAPLGAARAVPWAAPLFMALQLGPGFAMIAQRAHHSATEQTPALRRLPEWYEPDFNVAAALAAKHLGLAGAVQTLSAQVPEGACVFSIKPPLVAWYGRRDSFALPYEQLDDAAFEAWIRSKGCRHYLLIGGASPSYSRPLYPLERMGRRLQVLKSVRSRATGGVIAALAVEQPPPRD